jgi:hypothetical protein
MQGPDGVPYYKTGRSRAIPSRGAAPPAVPSEDAGDTPHAFVHGFEALYALLVGGVVVLAIRG